MARRRAVAHARCIALHARVAAPRVAARPAVRCLVQQRDAGALLRCGHAPTPDSSASAPFCSLDKQSWRRCHPLSGAATPLQTKARMARRCSGAACVPAAAAQPRALSRVSCWRRRATHKRSHSAAPRAAQPQPHAAWLQGALQARYAASRDAAALAGVAGRARFRHVSGVRLEQSDENQRRPSLCCRPRAARALGALPPCRGCHTHVGSVTGRV
jgi:hypothetical protein